MRPLTCQVRGSWLLHRTEGIDGRLLMRCILPEIRGRSPSFFADSVSIASVVYCSFFPEWSSMMLKAWFPFAILGITACSKADIVFDSLTPTNGWFVTTDVPHHLMGAALSLDNTASSPLRITGIDLVFVNFTLQSTHFVDIQLDVSFWEMASNATSGSSPAFSNRLASFTLHTGAFSPNINTAYRLSNAPNAANTSSNLGSGVTLNSTSNIGVQVLIRGDRGFGLTNNNDLALAVTNSTQGPAVGSFTAGTPGHYGHYSNISQPMPANADTSLLGSDFVVIDIASFNVGNNGLGLRLYSEPVPEPASVLILGVGSALFMKARRRSRRA